MLFLRGRLWVPVGMQPWLYCIAETWYVLITDLCYAPDNLSRVTVVKTLSRPFKSDSNEEALLPILG